MILFVAIHFVWLFSYTEFFSGLSLFSVSVNSEYSNGSFFFFVSGLFRAFSSVELFILCGFVHFNTP